jgi:AraC-like DNA-binding protein
MLAGAGVSPTEVTTGFGLTREALAAPGSRVPLALANAMLARAIALTGEPALGLLLGLQMRVSVHGSIGFAAMTARNVGEALRIAERFAPLRTTAVDLRLVVEGGEAAVVLVFDTDLAPLREVALLSVCVGLGPMGAAVTGRELVARAELDFPEPAYFARFRPMLGASTFRFGQATNRVVFDAAYLELPLVMADEAASVLALEACERELASLGAHAEIGARVRRVVEAAERGVPSVEEVAARLHLSTRTLKRQLAATGTTFTEVVEEVRKQRALLLLARKDLGVEQVADRLGYSDVANFTRAFRRWTGQTPAAWRGR